MFNRAKQTKIYLELSAEKNESQDENLGRQGLGGDFLGACLTQDQMGK